MAKKESTLYYFYSVGCGFCKKLDPIIDELIKEGHDILRLDLADKDNQGLKNELSKEYNKQCGTPWLIDASNGNQVCGYREKDIIEKWVNGEDIPAPPRPNPIRVVAENSLISDVGLLMKKIPEAKQIIPNANTF